MIYVNSNNCKIILRKNQIMLFNQATISKKQPVMMCRNSNKIFLYIFK